MYGSIILDCIPKNYNLQTVSKRTPIATLHPKAPVQLYLNHEFSISIPQQQQGGMLAWYVRSEHLDIMSETSPGLFLDPSSPVSEHNHRQYKTYQTLSGSTLLPSAQVADQPPYIMIKALEHQRGSTDKDLGMSEICLFGFPMKQISVAQYFRLLTNSLSVILEKLVSTVKGNRDEEKFHLEILPFFTWQKINNISHISLEKKYGTIVSFFISCLDICLRSVLIVFIFFMEKYFQHD